MLGIAFGVAGLLAASAAATAADVATTAQLEAQLSQVCPEYRAAAVSKAPAGWSCWAPGLTNPDAKGDVPAQPASHVQPTASVKPVGVQSPYLWTFNKTAYYGTTRRVIGSVQVEAQVSQNGRQSRNSMSLTRFAGPAIRQSLYIDCRHESNDKSCGDRAHDRAPTYDNESFSLRKDYLHALGREYYIAFNYYFGSLGNRNPSTTDGFFHVPPLHSAVFACRTTDRLCKF